MMMMMIANLYAHRRFYAKAFAHRDVKDADDVCDVDEVARDDVCDVENVGDVA